MKNTNLAIIILICLVLATIIPNFTATAGVNQAVSYLESQSVSPWITQALVVAGEDNITSDHLQSVSGSLATDYAKTILALTAINQNPATFGNIDYIAQLKTYLSNNQMGDESLVNDDAWSILALASAGQSNSSAVLAAKNFLINNQNQDGGWGYSVGGASDTNDTAAIIMALIEAGLVADDPIITDALDYLQSVQNNDGGFGWAVGDVSDSGSDSWVISALYKVGQNPANWLKNNNSPIDHLNSLQDADGGFWWVEAGTSDFNNKAMTAFAVIALSGKSYPVGYYTPDSDPNSYHLRIEGLAETICQTSLATAANALDIVAEASADCAYIYNIEDTAYGPYLNQINDQAASGTSGWMYFVNFASPPIGAADYELEPGDKVLWYYGEWGWHPLRLTSSDYNPEPNVAITLTVEYFDGQSWLVLPATAILGLPDEYAADNNGQVALALNDGYYQIYATEQGYVRSQKQAITVGGDIAQNIGLTVEVDQGAGGSIAGQAIIFEVTPSQLNFGKLKPGQQLSESLSLDNSGTVNLNISAQVTGDSLFIDNINIDQIDWSSYQTTLTAGASQQANVSLAIPAEYLGSGVKNGELIFWAKAYVD